MIQLKKELLKERFDSLGWTAYKLAQEVSRVRSAIFGEKKKPSNLISSVNKVLEDPNKASFKNVEAAVKAMGGELTIRWTTTEEVVTGHEDIQL